MANSTKKAIKDRCIDCCTERKLAYHCQEHNCPLHVYLLGGIRKQGDTNTPTRMKAIHAYCKWCCGGQSKEIRECPRHQCPLYIYRMGRINNDSKRISISRTEEKRK